MSREKEDLGKENQQLSRQLDEIKQGNIFFPNLSLAVCLYFFLICYCGWNLLLNFNGIYQGKGQHVIQQVNKR